MLLPRPKANGTISTKNPQHEISFWEQSRQLVFLKEIGEKVASGWVGRPSHVRNTRCATRQCNVLEATTVHVVRVVAVAGQRPELFKGRTILLFTTLLLQKIFFISTWKSLY